MIPDLPSEWCGWTKARAATCCCDMQANVIYKVTPEGKVPLDLYHSRYTGYDIWRAGMPQPDANRKDVFFLIGSKGLAVDRQGRLLIAKWSGRSTGRIEKNRKRPILADR